MIGVFRERFFTFRMKLKMFITSSDHYLKYLAILFLVKASGLGDFVSQNPLFSYGVLVKIRLQDEQICDDKMSFSRIKNDVERKTGIRGVKI